MRIEWLNKNSSNRVIVFFNGWGMDRWAVAHLVAGCDVVMIYDYRDLWLDDQLPDLTGYKEIDVVAWSMGVWAAASIISDWSISPHTLIGMNGTEHPVDDQWGIPNKIYLLTENGMSLSGREKFFRRMFADENEWKQFEQNKPCRSLEEICEELTLIRKQSSGLKNELKWDKIYISEKDVIFPFQNQIRWCRKKDINPQLLPGGHYPFYQFHNWEEIIMG